MKKCLGILAVLLLVCSAASAATTITNTVNSGSKFGMLVLFDTITPVPDAWSYSHTGIAPADGTWDTEIITSATLTIKYSAVTPGEAITITADSTNLGVLPVLGDSFTTATKTFTLSSSSITDQALNVVVSTPIYRGWDAKLVSSTVTVEYDEVLPPPPPPPVPTVPAPGVVVLGAMGLGLVSWLRSRRTL